MLNELLIPIAVLLLMGGAMLFSAAVTYPEHTLVVLVGIALGACMAFLLLMTMVQINGCLGKANIVILILLPVMALAMGLYLLPPDDDE